MSARSNRLRPPRTTQRRFAGAEPRSYDADTGTVEAVLSTGTSVKRAYGTERLSIAPDAVDLQRLYSSGVPLLDSHRIAELGGVLGRVERVWFANGALMGKLAFGETEEAREAEGMVARGEIAGVSTGYQVKEWTITDADGNVLDPDRDRIRYDDDLTFTATLWELLEVSLVSVPADPAAAVRSYVPGAAAAAETLARMRQRECEQRSGSAQPPPRRWFWPARPRRWGVFR